MMMMMMLVNFPWLNEKVACRPTLGHTTSGEKRRLLVGQMERWGLMTMSQMMLGRVGQLGFPFAGPVFTFCFFTQGFERLHAPSWRGHLC